MSIFSESPRFFTGSSQFDLSCVHFFVYPLYDHGRLSSQTYPDYYEIIERPIAINDIRRKCRGHLYADVQEFRDDWKLLFSNARKFNGEESWVAVDSGALEKELERVIKRVDSTKCCPRRNGNLYESSFR